METYWGLFQVELNWSLLPIIGIRIEIIENVLTKRRVGENDRTEFKLKLIADRIVSFPAAL